MRRFIYEEEEALEPDLAAALESASEEERFADEDELREQLHQRLLARGARITLDEVLAAVKGIAGLRYAEEQTLTTTNPRTGERISIKLGPGAFEALLGGKWVHGFHWSQGRISWRAFHPWDAEEEMAASMAALANALKARVFDEDGEEQPTAWA